MGRFGRKHKHISSNGMGLFVIFPRLTLSRDLYRCYQHQGQDTFLVALMLPRNLQTTPGIWLVLIFFVCLAVCPRCSVPSCFSSYVINTRSSCLTSSPSLMTYYPVPSYGSRVLFARSDSIVDCPSSIVNRINAL